MLFSINKVLYISLLATLWLKPSNCAAQNFLQIEGNSKADQDFVDALQLDSLHCNSNSDSLIFFRKIQLALWSNNYFNAIISPKLNHYCSFTLSLGKQVETNLPTQVVLNSNIKDFKPRIKKLNTRNLNNKLSQILEDLDQAAYPFAQLQLQERNDSLIVTIQAGQQFQLDSVIFKGENNFPFW